MSDGSGGPPAEPSPYGLLERFALLHGLLAAAPHSLAELAAALPEHYSVSPGGCRRLSRDLGGLRALGYTAERQGRRPARSSLAAGPHLLADADVVAMSLIRESFAGNHRSPHALSGSPPWPGAIHPLGDRLQRLGRPDRPARCRASWQPPDCPALPCPGPPRAQPPPSP